MEKMSEQIDRNANFRIFKYVIVFLNNCLINIDIFATKH